MSNDLAPREVPWSKEPDRLSSNNQKAAMRAAVRAIANQCAEFETEFFAMLAARWLGVAQGAQLDKLGKLLREPRKGRSDVAYTLALRLAVRTRRSNGRTGDIFDILDLTGYEWKYRERYPAGFRVEVYGAESVEAATWVFKARGGGVAAEVVFMTDAATTFTAEHVATGTPLTGNVWASVHDRSMGFGLASARRV